MLAFAMEIASKVDIEEPDNSLLLLSRLYVKYLYRLEKAGLETG